MISVCMATYNGARFIKEQIDSIIPQLSENDELIISDDGSTDGTLDIINSYNDERIKVLHHQKNPEFAKIRHSRNFYYATSNFENALIHAKGDYIFLSDQDDVWMPDKVERMITMMRDNNADCVMCNFSLIDEDGTIISNVVLPKNSVPRTLLFKILKSRLIGSSMAFHKSLKKKIFPFPKKLLAHDLWIGCLAKRVLFIDIPLTLYRRYRGTVSTGIDKSGNPVLYKVLYRTNFLFLVLKHKWRKMYE